MLTSDEFAEVVQVGEAIGGAAETRKVGGQALCGRHLIRAGLTAAARLGKITRLNSQPRTHRVLEQKLRVGQPQIRSHIINMGTAIYSLIILVFSGTDNESRTGTCPCGIFCCSVIMAFRAKTGCENAVSTILTMDNFAPATSSPGTGE